MFAAAAAQAYGALAAQRRQTGRPVDTADVQIAAIALARKLDGVATRNVGHFQDCGVPLIDPWRVP